MLKHYRRHRVAMHLKEFEEDHSHTFTLDTNIILELARDEPALLMHVANCPGFRLTETNIGELKNPQGLLRQFLDAARTRYVGGKASKAFLSDLEQLIPLIPRKLAYDVMVLMDDSYVAKILEMARDGLKTLNRLKEKKAKGSIKPETYQKKVEELEHEFSTAAQRQRIFAFNRITHLFEERCRKQGVDVANVDTRFFFDLVRSHMSDVVRKIQEIFANAGNMDISTLLSRIDDELAKFAKKSYQADAEFVAATVASAAEGESNDRDVNALIHLYDALLKSRKSA